MNLGPERAPLATGSQLGPYHLEAVIGKGGMGFVYRAVDTKLNRPVAIKFLSGDLADAAAYAGLSMAGRSLRTFGFTQDEGAKRSAALTAAELDPNLAEAHTAMGLVRSDDWDRRRPLGSTLSSAGGAPENPRLVGLPFDVRGGRIGDRRTAERRCPGQHPEEHRPGILAEEVQRFLSRRN